MSCHLHLYKIDIEEITDIFYLIKERIRMTQELRFSRNLMLAFGVYVLLTLSTVVGQTTIDTSAVGTWIGTLEAGGTRLRLVLHINITSTGILTGTVDSPDKGIKGIPLSRVYVNGDSLVAAISAALAGYEGKFSNNKTTIEGIWKEDGTSFPMILNRKIGTIESEAFHGDAKPPSDYLNLQKTSQHFDLYSSDTDRKALDDIAKTLEDNYGRITEHLRTQFTKRIKVYIYPDIKTFHDAIHMPNAPDWVVGAGGINELKMVSPLNPGSAHTYASLMQAIVHELTHAAVLNARGERGLAGLPKWLNEGYAFYEAHQMNDDMRRTLKSHLSEKLPPTWGQLDTASIVEFGNIDGYALSTIIIEFLINKYGFEKLLRLIMAPENMDAIYGISKGDLEKQWIQYLKTI
jgi:hypothetical protein